MDYVKWLLAAGVALASTGPVGASATEASAAGAPEIEVTHSVSGELASLARSTDVDVKVEFQIGLFAYQEVANLRLAVKEGEESRILVRFRNEPYTVTFHVRGEALHPEGEKPQWAFELVRQDRVSGAPSAEPQPHYFIVERDGRVRFRTTGWYQTQMRNLRLTFSLF